MMPTFERVEKLLTSASPVLIINDCAIRTLHLLQEKAAIGAMFEREMKQEKNLELRERDLRRARAVEAEAKVNTQQLLQQLYRNRSADYVAVRKGGIWAYQTLHSKVVYCKLKQLCFSMV
eukprot:TRINITY_DN4346_c0_g2_i5.p3 TRINITY_DN4346_c0_g2~~TRINITY_DN4346_c0_g2_i5.p3  ORF type:complete len:120 (+),score=24.74 TRINITY_DN4346_c0_g2_i5:1835-2194(+)